jgi:hypothetical protein
MAPEYILLAVVVNIAVSSTVAYAAFHRGRSVVGFFALSFLLSFFVGILVLLALPAREADTSRAWRDRPAELRYPCPHCLEKVLPGATVCPHCHSALSLQTTQDVVRSNQGVIETDRKKELLNRAEFQAWAVSGLPDLSDWEPGTDFAEWLATKR